MSTCEFFLPAGLNTIRRSTNAVVEASGVRVWREDGWRAPGLQIRVKDSGTAVTVALSPDDARRLAIALIEQSAE